MGKIILLILSSFIGIAGFSQQQTSRGIKPADDPQTFSGSTKLVVVGVSKYQNIQSLSYAHTDAQAFYNYMVSKEGGNIDMANTRLLLNEKATSAEIIASLNWLIDATKEGETVIFYFAGHGDLEHKTMFQEGFLLANDAPMAAYMAGGTVQVSNLQKYLLTLVQMNKARVILITDACHSGKLAGGLEGVANTATALQGNWENTIKILSSQPGELSQEGAKWNGGGGVFTYYLVKGMMGFADRNHDYKITVNEMNVYLMDNVPSETNFSQNPSVLGNPTTVLSIVDSLNFLKIKDNDKAIKIDNSAIAQRGSDDDLKKTLDTAIYRLYQEFYQCIDKHNLINANKLHTSAWDIYHKIKDDKKAASIVNSMRFSLVAALQNRYQTVVNKYVLNGLNPPVYLDQSIYKEIEYAYKLADTSSISFTEIKSRYLLMKVFSDESLKDKEALAYIDQSLLLQPDNPVAYWAKAEYFVRKKKPDLEKSIESLDIAISLAPLWPWLYRTKGERYLGLNKVDEAENCFLEGAKKCPEYVYFNFKLAGLYAFHRKDLDKAMVYINKLDSIATLKKNAKLLCELGDSYFDKTKDTAKALSYYLKAIEADSTYHKAYYSACVTYKQLGDLANWAKYGPMGNRVQYARLVQIMNEMPDLPGPYYDAAKVVSNWDVPKAVGYLEMAIISGYDQQQDYKDIMADKELKKIINSPEFEALMKKYFSK